MIGGAVSKPKVKVVEHDTRQGWIYPMFDVIRHIFIIPLQNQRSSKGEKALAVDVDIRE